VPDQLTLEERAGFGLATVMARKGVTAKQVADALGAPLVDGPSWSSNGELALLGSGPGTWLVLADDPATHAERLRAALGPLASVSDQSGAYLILRLSGPEARTVLQRGAPVDLHPSAFGPGSVATTVIAHIGVVIRQLDAAPTYEVAVFRSYAASFRHWLAEAIAAL
jgi:heterotetrameric sarcosine oxidase gamma subunit